MRGRGGDEPGRTRPRTLRYGGGEPARPQRPPGRLDTTLVLGGTGRTGSRLAVNLRARSSTARTAARNGGDLRFDWDDPATQATALIGVDRVYLVAPVPRVRYADTVSAFLDLTQTAGVRHVTYLSTHRGYQAPPTTDFAAVERDLTGRSAFTHTILRPAWVMQNFGTHVPISDGVIPVRAGTGTEAFVDATDIAAVAAETLTHPEEHAGKVYTPTGPDAPTFAEVAAIISEVRGEPVRYQDIDRKTWVDAVVATGFVPADYGVVLDWQAATVASGNGSRPTDDVYKVTGRPSATLTDFARRTWTPEEGK